MSRARTRLLALGFVCLACLLTGCERHFFQSQGLISSDGGELFYWSRPVEGCSPDPLDGLPPERSSTLFTFYWDNPVSREEKAAHTLPNGNKLQRLEISRTPEGLHGLVKTTLINPEVQLDDQVCSTFNATTRPGRPVIAGGRPTVDGTLDLDCRVVNSHLTAHIRFSGCEY